MNNDLNLTLAQMLNKLQVEQSTNERRIKEIQNAVSERSTEDSDC